MLFSINYNKKEQSPVIGFSARCRFLGVFFISCITLIDNKPGILSPPSQVTASDVHKNLEFRNGRDFALIFATETYDSPSWRKLNNPIRETMTIAADLSDLYGFQVEFVANPSRNQVLDKLIEYARKSYSTNAQLLIFFSGHGHYDSLSNIGYIIPRDGKTSVDDRYGDSWLKHTDLRRRISAIPCPHILLAIDACFSGAIDEAALFKGSIPGDLSRPNENEAIRQRRIADLLRPRSRMYITAGLINYVPDPSDFAARFKEGLRSLGGSDGLLTIQGLYYTFLEKASSKPQLGAFENNEIGSTFLFEYNNHGSGISDNKKKITDDDADGIPDYLDHCPSIWARTPNGCPDQSNQINMIEITPDSIRSIYDGSWQLTKKGYYISGNVVTFDQFYTYCDAANIPRPERSTTVRNFQAVNNINLIDAVKYCNWVSAREDFSSAYTIKGNDIILNEHADGYRLPTRSELIYAMQTLQDSLAFNDIWEWCWNPDNIGKHHQTLIKLEKPAKSNRKYLHTERSNPIMGRHPSFSFRLARNQNR